MERFREKLPTTSGNESESSRKSAKKPKLPPGTEEKIRDIFSTDEDEEEGKSDTKKKRLRVRRALVQGDPLVIEPQDTEQSGTPQHTPAFLEIAADIGKASIRETLQEDQVPAAGGSSVKPKSRPNPFTATTPSWEGTKDVGRIAAPT